ncbi:MAG: FkbM family methyltransferase [Victivallaceae bacterium]
MRRMFKEIYLLLRALVDPRKWDLDKSLKTKIRTTYFRVLFLKRYDARNKIADIAGFKVKFCDADLLSGLFNEIFLHHEYHFTAANETPHIIDCGSNIGMSVIYFKMLYPEAEIVAFEPGKEAFACLDENIKNNLLSPVTAHQTALADREGEIDFYCDQDKAGSLVMSTNPARMSKQKRVVKVTRLSNYIDRTVDFLKMDVEGAEMEIMEDLRRADKLKHIRQMAIEYHHHIISDSNELSKMLRLLEDAGFGYQMESYLKRPFIPGQFQDILIYAYRP